MGMTIFGNSCLLTPPGSAIQYPNPNPARFTIIRSVQIGVATVIEILYPDCTNYEGHKILVYAGTTQQDLRSRSTLDPHFSEDGGPIARFKPSIHGWGIALRFARMMNNAELT